MTRRGVLKRVPPAVGAGVVGLSGTAAAQDGQSGGPTVGTEQLASGFVSPTAMAAPPGEDRLFVCDQPGQIYVYESGGLRTDPVLDIEDRITTKIRETYSEQGLLGIAFHPDFQSNGRLYVRYSSPPRDGTPKGWAHTFVLSEFEMARDGSAVDPDSERVVLTVPEPSTAHNSGSIAFGPDGYLYVGVGDGGHQKDTGPFGHASDWYDDIDGGNGQDVTENLLGSVLRIDVNQRDGDQEYGIPDDNPLVGREGLDEHFAWGLRNPWKMTFNDGRLFVADVGQVGYEEINIVENGGNYGWNVKEGTDCFETNNCPDSTPEDVRGGEPLLDPIIEYPHGGGREDGLTGVAAIAGYVYERSDIEGLQDKFVFGDWRQGKVFAGVAPDGDGEWSMQRVGVAGTDSGLLGGLLQSFGRDNEGRLYALTASNPTATANEDEGKLLRFVPPEG